MSEQNMRELFGIAERTFLVTGACGAIGSKIVDALLGLGANVGAVDLKVPAAPESTGRPVLYLEGNAASEPDAARVFAAVRARFGAVHTLVNAAGINIRDDVANLKIDDLRAVMEANLTSTVVMSKAFAAEPAGEDRCIVNLASIAGSYGIAGAASYCTSKAAMISFTQVCAIEWAKSGIRVNAIAPSAIRTPMMAARLNSPTQSAALLSRIPLGRFGEPEDLVGPIVFLSSKAASWVTGHILTIDGGRTATT